MNQYDSDRMSDLAKDVGYLKTNDSNNTDCYILNTCHIRDKATEKVYSDIGRLRKNYKNKSKPIVLITGCVAQAENSEMLKREPYIDAVIGPQSYHRLPEILKQLDKKKNKINRTDFDVIEKFDKLNYIQNTQSKVSSFITVQEGCDKFCNFCVVPYTRGPEYSRSPKEILNEAKTLIFNGAKEITLLGQNVNAYKYKNGGKNFNLADLLIKLNDLDGLKRLRYTTSHPNDMSKELIECYKFANKLMPFLHLPIQSGSNNVLKKMNRKHTREKYLDIINKIKDINSEVEFSSDFIVGYPGESEKDFFDTVSLVKKIKFINSFSFIYNPRPGTPAAALDRPDIAIQKKRLVFLQDLLKKIQEDKNQNSIGLKKEVLVENRLKKQNKYFGRTKNLTPVILRNTEENDVGKILNIEIENFNGNSLFGKKEKAEKEVAA